MRIRSIITQITSARIQSMNMQELMRKGISGTNTKKRDEFNRMIADCRAGKIEIKLAYLIQRIGTEYLKNRRNKGFRHIWRDRKPFSFYDSSFSDMKQK